MDGHLATERGDPVEQTARHFSRSVQCLVILTAFEFEAAPIVANHDSQVAVGRFNINRNPRRPGVFHRVDDRLVHHERHGLRDLVWKTSWRLAPRGSRPVSSTRARSAGRDRRAGPPATRRRRARARSA